MPRGTGTGDVGRCRRCQRAHIDVSGAGREVSTLLLADPVAVGDWLLVHVGFALARIDEDEATATLDLLAEALEAEALDDAARGTAPTTTGVGPDGG